ncbi:MAG: FAD binding domain-containing protein [Synergistaceae bacterium]|nr:FAD binding domain-containing protein [Synergistaceae bacterium]
MRIELTVNGRLRHAEVPPMKLLIAVLREELGLCGTKEGCGEGECGACSVIMNGRLTNACLVPAVQASGSEILTIEGLGSSRDMDALQRAFVLEGGVQCGFCTPGMILAARALLEENPDPSAEEIKEALSGNICRCTGYERIYNAVRRAVAEGYCDTFRKRENLCSGQLPQPTGEGDERFLLPESLPEALSMLAENPGAVILAGTTDIVPDMKNGKFHAEKLLDISRLKEIKGIYKAGGEIHIGGCATNGDIIRSSLIRKYLPALWEASRRSGAPAVQNRATVAGNIATASGAADLPTILLPLGARVLLESVSGSRELPLERFIAGYRRTERREEELIAEIIIPTPPAGSYQKFFKRGSRRALTLSRISLGFCLEVEENVIKSFRAGAGSMSPVPIRLPKTEAAIEGKRLDETLIESAALAVSEELTPRKSAAWRKKMASNMLRTFLREVAEAEARKAKIEEIPDNEREGPKRLKGL